MSSYNGKLITYDKLGNPKTYDGNTYTWEGRQLKSIKDFKKHHFNYEDTLFYAFGEIDWMTMNFTTGETHIYRQYKGDKRIEALI